MIDNQLIPHKFWPRRVSWLTVVLALLAVGTLVAVSRPGVYYATRMGIDGGMMENSSGSGAVPPSAVDMPMMDGDVSNKYYPYPYPSPDVPITDTREFLKIYYNASMQTRDVQGLTRRVETTVRGYDGRIDQQSSSPKYGYVNFALPQSKYDAFRAELEDLVGSKFLTVNISSQNLLAQKVSIEEQQKQAETALADYKTVRQKIVNAHASAVQLLQSKIDAAEGKSDELALLNEQLANENTLYAKRLDNADRNIKYGQDWLKAVQTQDQTLLANVATVSGTISIQWISYWAMAQLYLPGYWIPIIFAVLTLLSFLWDRRRFGTGSHHQ
ncbi:MAG: DUF4349 domain-containing protein [Candidatus Paceibacterota bacterium]|jgi:hypothetical protein